jgi:ABC-2 type transport system permease protein
MTASLRAEWLKLVTTRTFWGLLYAAAGAGALAAFIGAAQGPPPWDVTQPLRSGTAWSLGALMITVLAVVLGSRTFTEDFTHDTIVHTFVADPGRRRSTLAKATVAALASTLVAAVAAGAIGATTYAMAAVTGGDLKAFPSDGAAALGLLAAAGVMGIIGAAVGALVRHPVPAIVGALLWLFVAENLVSLLAGSAAGYLPGKLATILAGVPQGAVAPSGTVAAAAMAGYAAVLTLAGMLVLRRRDVL